MRAVYFVEQYPERGQLIYVFHGKDEEPVRPSHSNELARYWGNGILVNATMSLVEIDAGLAWEPVVGKVVPATLK